MKRLLIVLAIVVGFGAGCSVDALFTSKTNNPKLEVETLFEHDGCRVYRFYDAGYAIYYVKCSPNFTGETAWQEHHGKYSVPKRVETAEEN